MAAFAIRFVLPFAGGSMSAYGYIALMPHE